MRTEFYADAVLVVHGGAGNLRAEGATPEREAAYHEGLRRALAAGGAVIDGGHSALDAVTAAVQRLEDDPLFNAGRGAAFTHEGGHELDAAIMDGATGRAGAAAGVRTTRNPIMLARAVLERSPYVFVAAAGADGFARECGLVQVSPDYFDTPERLLQLRREIDASESVRKFGTVGAVARDRAGNLAAATSTGGMSNKRWGRVGDSPVIGAGTWASNRTCAVSATGHGEYFLRLAIAHDLSARMRYAGASLLDAADAVIHSELANAGGEGGVIALDANGNAATPFNTGGMYRAVLRANGEIHSAIYAG
jgi:beta-aspartyl-peptidase (threonine type)